MARSSALVGLLAIVSGCGSGDERAVRVAGEVTYKGQPVPYGSIVFDPDVQAGNKGPQGSAKIKDGHFDTANSGLGLTGGAYTARITGFSAEPDLTSETNQVKPLFPEYKEKVDLKSSTDKQTFAIQ
jgi:hypothetical protein